MRREAFLTLIISAAFVATFGGCTVLGSGQQGTIEALESADSSRRIEALSGLGNRVTPAMRGSLEEILRTDMNPTVRAMAASALGDLGMEKSVEELRLSARRDSSWIVRRRALHALAGIAGGKVADDLRYVLNHDAQETVRVEAIQLAGEYLEGGVRTDILLMGLKDDSHAVRLSAHLELSQLTGENIPPGDYEGWENAVQSL